MIHNRFAFINRRTAAAVLGFLVLLTTLFTLTPGTGRAEPTGPPPPFQPGERLVYELKWEFIKAGEASLSVMPIETVDGTAAFHFVMTARSVPFIDVFYKVRDRIDAYANLGLDHSVFYKKKQREGKTRRDIVVLFDWKKNEARYIKSGKPRDPIELMPGAFDPLSALYYVRTIPPRPDTFIERPVTDGKRNVMGRATFVKKERIKVNGSEYDAFLIEPELKHIRGVFEKSEGASIRVWISADHRRIPLRVKSKVAVGSFLADLISAEGLAPPPERGDATWP
jgi:hypothetical protein